MDSADTRLLIQGSTGSEHEWRLIRNTARYAPWSFLLVSDQPGQIWAPHWETAQIQCNRSDGPPCCRGPGVLNPATPVSVAESEANTAMGRRHMKRDLVAGPEREHVTAHQHLRIDQALFSVPNDGRPRRRSLESTT